MKILQLRYLTFLALIIIGASCSKVDVVHDDVIKTNGDERNLGFVPTPENVLNTVPSASVPLSGNLPTRKLLSFPPAASQGNEGSCLSFALAYGVMSFHKGGNFISAGNINSSAVYSPEYVFGQTRVNGNNCLNTGSYFVTYNSNLGALDLLVQQGVCTWEIMPYSDTDGCNNTPSQAQRDEAKKNKLSRYEKVNKPYSEIYLKSLIANNYPIIIGATVDEGFMVADANYIWDRPSGPEKGYHAMVVIGYDDALGAFRVLNSWGQYWGEDGLIWLKYSYFNDAVSEAYITFPDTTNNNNPNPNDNCIDGSGTLKIITKTIGNRYFVLDQMPFNLPYFTVARGDTLNLPGICAGLRAYYVYNSTSDAVNEFDLKGSGTIVIPAGGIETLEVAY
ncbi:hypothetical protein BH09BAC1_BH09BAC1_18370 [soil metagenome]